MVVKYCAVKYKIIFFGIIVSILMNFLLIFYKLCVQVESDCFFNERIDVVYTWVNGSDPKFLQNYLEYVEMNSTIQNHYGRRYNDKYELKYSLRSLEKYAPWINHVYIVTNGQIPHWLNLNYEKVSVITHEDIFFHTSDLPTFSSPAIESHLHRIPGLSDRFIYFNDDFFLDAPTFIDDFVSPAKGFFIYLAWILPPCADGCPWVYVGDGRCEVACNNTNCQMDGGDCNNDVETISLLPSKQWELLKRHMMERARNETKLKNGTAHIDFYVESLRHTNRIYNLKYGFKPRYVAAHAPILIDKRIMTDLHKTFESEFRKTSRNKVRSIDDMQFAFSYYYYLINEKRNLSIDEIFDRFDTDGSGTWSNGEIRTIIAQLYDVPLQSAAVEKFDKLLWNCSSKLMSHLYVDLKFSLIPKVLVGNCSILRAVLVEKFASQQKYKHEIIYSSPKSPITFIMLRSNVTDVLKQLDAIRRHTKKFICLNDDMNEIDESQNQIVREKLNDFYLDLFPKLSKFELATGEQNHFLHSDELEQWKSYHFNLKICLCICIIVLCYMIYCNLIKKRAVYKVANKVYC